MKKLILVLNILALSVIGASALTPKQMNGRACYGLLGPVKKVTYDPESVVYFSSTGQLLGWNSQDIKYTSANAYKKDSYVYRVSYTATTRTDQQTTGEKFKKVYKFDAKGRIIEEYSNMDFYVQETKYYYKGNSKFPYRVTYSGGEGGVLDTSDYQYEYLEFDSHGNWTKCRYKGVEMVEDHEDPEVKNVSGIVTRTITYY